jgi:carbon storage regulator
MLVFSRRTEEAVIIDGLNSPERAVKVKVLEIRGRSVLLGFEVNRDIPVHRQEVWERIRAGVGTGCAKGGA